MQGNDSADHGDGHLAAPNGRPRRRLLALGRPPEPWSELTEEQRKTWAHGFVDKAKARLARYEQEERDGVDRPLVAAGDDRQHGQPDTADDDGHGVHQLTFIAPRRRPWLDIEEVEDEPAEADEEGSDEHR